MSTTPEPLDTFDSLTAMLARQREWSRETFGPGDRLKGVLAHIRKELDEIEAAPTDVTEWIDVVILAFDGAWRAGHEPTDIVAALLAKYAKNRARTWPDWRTASPDAPIEHVRQETPEPLDAEQSEREALARDLYVTSTATQQPMRERLWDAGLLPDESRSPSRRQGDDLIARGWSRSPRPATERLRSSTCWHRSMTLAELDGWYCDNCGTKGPTFMNRLFAAEAERDEARAQVQRVEALADRGVGVDLNPTINLAVTDAAWWYGYLRSLDENWRDRLRAAIGGGGE